ncbi:class I adenylate-forming enzyme family protein [Amycolatopsis circi]|uniref:class I adenylate-forming enzyme family protein n=1 Tax=Amycolatopsis circi TaxID=871959 RepID=UPI000E23C4B6|nr:class I adenylate-forming enzyme family protein [Amycolatopsis circi]
MPDNLTQFAVEHSRLNGWDDLPAFLADDRTWTFAEVYAGAARVAGGYRAAGLRRGDRVLLALPDSVEMVWCLLGAWQAGIVAIPVNVQMSQDDLTRDIRTAEPALIVADPETAGWLDDAGLAPTTGAQRLAAAEPETEFAPGGDRPSHAMFTSGTTGAPKLCFYLHSNFDPSTLRTDGVGTVAFSVSRMYFAGGLYSSAMATICTGQTSVLSRPRATPAAALELIRRYDVATLFAQPSFYARLLQEPGHAETLGKLRGAMCAGEVLSARLREKLVPIFGDRLVNLYGSTEAGGYAAGRPADYPDPSAIGPVFEGRSARIVVDGQEMAAGVQGELQVLVPFATRGVARGSLGPDQVTDTWWSTGDLGSIDAQGVIHVYGRLDDVEVIGGQNVVPGEVERLLESHPKVREAAVSAVRREAGDTTLRAYVVATSGNGDDDLGAELVALTREHLSWYKVPQDVTWLEALPRNANGKVLRRKLRTVGGQ